MKGWTIEHVNAVNARRRGEGAKLERPAGDEPLEAHQVEARNPGRCVVRVTSRRRRLLDEDNLAEKYHVDCLRYAGLLHSDAPDQTHIEVAQVKVATKDEECTVIEIDYAGP